MSDTGEDPSGSMDSAHGDSAVSANAAASASSSGQLIKLPSGPLGMRRRRRKVKNREQSEAAKYAVVLNQ